MEKDYTGKYIPYMLQNVSVGSGEPPFPKIACEADGTAETVGEEFSTAAPTVKESAIPENTDIFKELKSYRLKKSREEQVKPYFLYNDNQLRDLITKMPKNKADLQRVNGFGPVKAEKYGDDILEIIKKFS